MKRRVVITGMGAISPVGLSAKETWTNVRNGVVGIAPIETLDTEERQVKVAGEVKGFDPTEIMDKMEARRSARFTQFAIKAALEAFEQSGLNMAQENALRFGVNIGSGIGSLQTIEEEYRKGQKRGFDRISPLFVPMAIVNMAAGSVAIRLGFKGSCTCCVTACASGTNSIGEAFHAIRDGYFDVMAAGGSEACISDLGLGGFTSMKALTTAEDPLRASIPFDRERGGFVLGEGAGVLILEEYEHAVKRGAHIYAELAGGGANCDAYHMTAPDPEGEGAADVMLLALEDAGLTPKDVDYINVHGTSTGLGDVAEPKAIQRAFGEHAYDLNISSTKSMTGHLLGAAGALEAIACVLAVKNNIVPPTINFSNLDPELDPKLNFTFNKAQEKEINVAISNTFGFGGHNACVVFKK